MKKSVKGVTSLTGLLDEQQALSEFIDTCNDALSMLNANPTKLELRVGGDTYIDLSLFDTDFTRRFIVARKNEALEELESYDSKITQLTGLL